MGKAGKALFIIILFILMIMFRCSPALSQDLPSPESWSLVERIDGNEDELRNINLKIGHKKFSYTEERIVYNQDGKITAVSYIRITDEEKEIALQLLNLETGATHIIKITKRGSELIVPAGYEIRIVKRINGIRWNGRNTHFEIVRPTPYMVLKLAYPVAKTRTITKTVRDKNGKNKTVKKTERYAENSVYSPYSSDNPETADYVEGFHTPAIILEGRAYHNYIFAEACRLLTDRKVMSRAFPGSIVCDLPFLPLDTYKKLLLIEQIDESEFYLDPAKSVERIWIILRTNRGRAFSTCNSKKPWRACGPAQFTDRWRTVRTGKKRVKAPGTYSSVVRAYPSAGLINNFPEGAFDHINSAMAAILLHDLNLAVLVNKFGSRVTDNPVLLGEWLAGAYNGSPVHVHNALNDYFNGKITDWSDSRYLKRETQGYLKKYRYLENNSFYTN